MLPSRALAAAVLVCCSYCLHAAVGLKVVVVPMPSDNSPVLDLMAVAAHLQSRGHSVYVVADPKAEAFAKMAAARHSSNTTAEAMHYIHVAEDHANTLDAVLEEHGPELKKMLSQSRLAALKLLTKLQQLILRPCKSILANATVVQHLRELQPDVVMSFGVPTAGADCCGCMLSDALGGVPWIDVYGHPIIYSPMSVPQMGSGNSLKDMGTWKAWLKNIPPYLVFRVTAVLPEVMGNPWAQARKELGLTRLQSAFPPANAMAWLLGAKWQKCEPLLQVQLNSWLIEYARPLQPNQVLVGPGTPRPAHPISPLEVSDFVDSAPAGVVLMATGTTPQAKLVLSAKDVAELAEGFALLAPTRVLWAMKEKHLPGGLRVSDLQLADNIKLVPWVDYNDVLGHPNIRALVSHGGWHTMNEAAFHGVPVVGVPFQFEQSENINKLANHGMAVMMPNAPALRGQRNVSFERQQVVDTIRKVMDDPRYAAAATGTAHALQLYSKRRHPYARAADEIELAVYTQHAQQPQNAPHAYDVLRLKQQQQQDEL